MAAFLDVCSFAPTLGGTTDWTYSAALTGYQSPAAAGAVNGAPYRVRAESADLTQWEITTGTYNSGTGVFSRTTVLYNSSGTGTGAGQSGAGTKINFSTVPRVAVVALAEDMGPLTLTSATLQATPSNPTGTTNTTGVMMGLGSTCKITPVYSSRVFLQFSGIAINTIAINHTLITSKFGTGSAPANAASVTGTTVGAAVIAATSSTASAFVPFGGLGGVITGLTPGTAYWFDLYVAASTSGTASIADVTCAAMEF
jgi:hypothetical protein